MKQPAKIVTAWDRGYRESSKARDCDSWNCPCTLSYWEGKIAHWTLEAKSAFYNGWTFAATGDMEYRRPYN